MPDLGGGRGELRPGPAQLGDRRIEDRWSRRALQGRLAAACSRSSGSPVASARGAYVSGLLGAALEGCFHRRTEARRTTDASRRGRRADSTRMTTQRAKESVWDYPRPPRVEPLDRHVRIVLGGETIAESDRALRVLETASPPTIYVPREDVRDDVLIETRARTPSASGRAPPPTSMPRQAASGPRGSPGTTRSRRRATRSSSAISPSIARRVDAAYLDDELVTPQPGAYYGGWITEEIEGPFKGEPGIRGLVDAARIEPPALCWSLDAVEEEPPPPYAPGFLALATSLGPLEASA